MALYAGIDLHSNNNVVVVQDEEDKVVGQGRVETWRGGLGAAYLFPALSVAGASRADTGCVR